MSVVLALLLLLALIAAAARLPARRIDLSKRSEEPKPPSNASRRRAANRRSAGDRQDPEAAGPTDPRPAACAGASSRSIPNDLRSQNRLPTQADAGARSEFEPAVSSGTLSALRPLRRPNRPKQHRDFHETLRRLTHSPVQRYTLGPEKGGLNFLYIETALMFHGHGVQRTRDLTKYERGE